MSFKIQNFWLLLVVTVLLSIQPSTSSPIEHQKLAALNERFDNLQMVVESLQKENEALKNRVDCLERKDIEKEEKIRNQEKEILQLKAKMDAKLEFIQSSTVPSHDALVTDLRNSNGNKMNSIYRKLGDPSDDFSTRGVAPSSCRELSMIGYILDGLYLVQNPDTKQIETVLCTFGTSSISEALIGHVDVKTKTVHFFVQRISKFGAPDAIIPFELARLNEGGAFNLPSGIFTVPVPGIYHFDFSAVKDFSAPYLEIYIQVNSVNVGRSDTSATESTHVVALSISLRLAAGDKVNLATWGSSVLYDDNLHRTHFSGWLVEEELV